jgi:hypothetical protein
MIPMGDIDLQHEICLDNNSVVSRYYRRESARVRRIYSAKISGRSSGMTVAMYQGNSAKKVSSFMSLKYMF